MAIKTNDAPAPAVDTSPNPVPAAPATEPLFGADDLSALAAPEDENEAEYVAERSVEIPQEIKDFTNRAHAWWKAGNQNKWRHVVQSSEDNGLKLIAAMKLFGSELSDPKLTVQVKQPFEILKGEDGKPDGRVRVIYRVRDQIQRRNRKTSGDSAGE